MSQAGKSWRRGLTRTGLVSVAAVVGVGRWRDDLARKSACMVNFIVINAAVGWFLGGSLTG